jgi:Protein of unknown function (DUF1761)
MNWIAILVAAVVDWLIGAVWFTVFGKAWMAGLNIPPEQLEAYRAHPNFWPYVIAFLCSLILAFVIARTLAIGETHTLVRGVRVGILVGLATAVALITELAFQMMGQTFIAISAGYPLVGCIIMGIILGAWKPKFRASLGEAAS